MKTTKIFVTNKTKVTTIALVLVLTISATLVALPVVNAHTPPASWPTVTHLVVTPNCIGVGQQAWVYVMLNVWPPTALGASGDLWHNLTVEVKAPDGTTSTIDMGDSEPTGGAWALYVPDQVGTYEFKGIFPGQTLVGENLHPTAKTGQEYIGDYFEPSTSRIVELTVQSEQIPGYKETPLPTDYWTRPIYGENRDWWSISGNWLSSAPNLHRAEPTVASYTTGPESAHILWTREMDLGGLIGGEYSSYGYHSGGAYEGKWMYPTIINGRLYYNLYPDDRMHGREGTYPRDPSQNGFVCVDLRTGEELWRNYDDRISFGQVYNYRSPNQQGAFAYLWSKAGTTWKAYNAFDGRHVCTIENVPSGWWAYGSDGSILIYQLNLAKGWLALWNSSAIPELLGGPAGTYVWQWRPYGKTVDGTTGYVWNVTIPKDLTGTITWLLEDRIVGTSNVRATGGLGLPTGNYTVWALSIKEGEQGKLLFQKTHVAPEGVDLRRDKCAASVEEGVFTLYSESHKQWWGYSLSTGDLLWGPTTPQAEMDSNYYTTGSTAYGRLFSTGYGGILYCYNITTGELLWTFEAKDYSWYEARPYPLIVSIIADGKIYVVAGEHSTDDPKPQDRKLFCIDYETGEALWAISQYAPDYSSPQGPIIADGIIVNLNPYDNRIYAIGKGASATTVTGPDTTIPLGEEVLIQGMVTDISPGTEQYAQTARFSNGVPAIADEYQEDWMEYVYMQQPKPEDAEGVEVVITTLDPNGNTYELGRTISDEHGNFGCMVDPPVPGEYKIIASFEGSDSYYGSSATTYISVGEASSAAKSIEPEPTEPEPTEPAEAPLITTETAIIAAVIVAVIIGIAAYWQLRKRK